jgi:hypothetical protein
MAGHPPLRSNASLPAAAVTALARPRVSRWRDGGEGLRGVGRVPGVHRLRVLGIFGGPASGRARPVRRRAVQVGERALALGTAPDQPGRGHGRARVGGTGAGRSATAGPSRVRLARSDLPRSDLPRSGLAPSGLASTQAAGRTGRLPFGACREDAAWRSHPVLTGAGGVHPGQFAGGLLGRFPGRMTGRPGSAHRVQSVRGTERPHRLRRGVARLAQGRTVCVCAPAHRRVPARGTAGRAMAA